MSTFAVTRETIGVTRPVKGADRIEIANLAGMDFQFVVPKGAYKLGDPVLYIPVDAVLPQLLIEKLGLTGKLAGSEQNRVKTIVLRGAYSQGVVAQPDLVPDHLTDPAEITTYLGITKWEPPPNEVKDGILMPRPDGQSRYDIESADRYTVLADMLLDQPVFITEKLEGENTWVYAAEGDVRIGMRDNTILPKEGVENRFHRVLKECCVDAFARALRERLGTTTVTVHGEYIGPGCGVGNYYDLPAPTVRLFDIRTPSGFVPPDVFLDAVERFYGDLDLVVPILQGPDRTALRQWLNGRTIKEASDGASLLAPKKRREGIVIKPLVEQRDDRIGRLLLKQRSPAYLANSDL